MFSLLLLLLHDKDSNCLLIRKQGTCRLWPGHRLPLNLVLVKLKVRKIVNLEMQYLFV